VALHAHTEGWNALLHGRKRWFLYPPYVLPPLQYPVYKGQMEWVTTLYPQIKANPGLPQPLECIQEAGDLIFIPEGWFHATINLEETIGVRYPFLPFFPFQSTFRLGGSDLNPFCLKDCWSEKNSKICFPPKLSPWPGAKRLW